jgi:hypothetical protein
MKLLAKRMRACARRCVRPDETGATVRCHAMRDGTARFAFTLGRAEFFLPLGLLARCFLEVSDAELFGRLLAAIPRRTGAPARTCMHAEVADLSRSRHCLHAPCTHAVSRRAARPLAERPVALHQRLPARQHPSQLS